MITIILAAGNNKRFKGKHKGALKARDGRSVLENIADDLGGNPLLLIAQRKHIRQLRKIELSQPGSKRLTIHAWLQKPTLGPLDTLWQAREWIKALLKAQDNGDAPIVISYCDVLLERKYFYDFIGACEKHDAGIVIFESRNERFGDAFPGISNRFKNSGVFYFRSGNQMLAMLQYVAKGNEELGVPDLVNFTHEPKRFVCNEVIDIGIPEDYKRYING